VSLIATANFIVGGPYTVAVGVGGPYSVTFSLTNDAAPAGVTYTVGTTADHVFGQTDGTTCLTAGNTTCTLRDAIAYAVSGTDTIAFNGTGRGTIALTSGTLTLAASVVIAGPGSSLVTVDGGCTGCDPGGTPSGGVRVFAVNGGVTVAIGGLTIQHGNMVGSGIGGGGIYNTGTLTVTNSTISGNATDRWGGGIYNTGTLTVMNSTISGNSVPYTGSGILNAGTATVTNATIASNRSGTGGGIANCPTAGCVNASDGVTMTITNTTITDNSVTTTFSIETSGGGIFNGARLTVTNSTISGNRVATTGSSINGGGIANVFAATITDTIIAGNSLAPGSFGTASGPDLSGTITTGGHNLIGTTDGATITLGPGDRVNPIPLLGTLGNYGGPTQTIPLLTGSPAIGHGDLTICTQSGAGHVNTLDQRRFARPTTLCAIGAFEPLLSAIGPSSGGTTGGAAVTLTGTGFAPGATVSLGGASCTNVQIVSSTTLRCTTATRAAGVVDVAVTVNSQTGTLTGGYTYGVVNPQPSSQPTVAAAGSPTALPAMHPAAGAGVGAPTPNPQPMRHP